MVATLMATESLSPFVNQINSDVLPVFSGVDECREAPGVPARDSGGGGAPAETPPTTKRGVEFSSHYWGASIWAHPDKVARWLCGLLGVEGDLRSFRATGYGSKGFRVLRIGPADIRLSMVPISQSKRHDGAHVGVVIPGEVCKALGGRLFEHAAQLQAAGVAVQVSRFDAAFDTFGFTPGDVWGLVARDAEKVRTLAKRERFKHIEGLGPDDETVTLGSRTSDRYLRVYAHAGGFTRVELECHDERADKVFWDLVGMPEAERAERAMGHLRDFVDFDCEWWWALVNGAARAHMKVSNWAASSFEKTVAYIENTMAGCLAVFEEILGYQRYHELLERGREKWTAKHLAVLAAYGGGGP